MPNWKAYIKRRLRAEHLEPERESGIIEELAQHLDDQYRELLARGETERDARRIVLSELGDGLAKSGFADIAHKRSSSWRSEPPGLGSNPTLGTRRKNVLADFHQDLRY